MDLEQRVKSKEKRRIDLGFGNSDLGFVNFYIEEL